ncbi:MAG TPA: hypothetical protein VGJ34_07385 [Gaiellaceae bacterium]|jgi:hypothetical protein
MRRALLLVSAVALAACGGCGNERSAVQPPPKATLPADLLALYDYDASAPFDVQESGVQKKDGATVHDMTYAGPTRPARPRKPSGTTPSTS